MKKTLYIQLNSKIKNWAYKILKKLCDDYINDFHTSNDWRCKKCHSDDVKILVWRNLKTGKLESSNIESCPDGETHQDIWCNNCKKYVGLYRI